jgi:hypothetical protein
VEQAWWDNALIQLTGKQWTWQRRWLDFDTSEYWQVAIDAYWQVITPDYGLEEACRDPPAWHRLNLQRTLASCAATRQGFGGQDGAFSNNIHLAKQRLNSQAINLPYEVPPENWTVC